MITIWGRPRNRWLRGAFTLLPRRPSFDHRSVRMGYLIGKRQKIGTWFAHCADTPWHTQSLGSGRSGGSRILRPSQFMILHTVDYICTYKGVRLKSMLPRNGIWPAVVWPPRRLCYCPAVFFHHLHLTVLSFSQGEILRLFQKCFYPSGSKHVAAFAKQDIFFFFF